VAVPSSSGVKTSFTVSRSVSALGTILRVVNTVGPRLTVRSNGSV
jgi:hypothetical protein